MPDKAIDLIDEAAAKIRIESLVTPPNLKEIEEKIETVVKEKEESIRIQDFEKAARLRDDEKKLKDELSEIKKEWTTNNQVNSLTVSEENIANVVSSWTKIPVEKLTEKESDKLLRMEEILKKRVVGQEEAVKAVARAVSRMEEILKKRVVGQEEAVRAVARAVRRARVGLRDTKRPIGSFIFLGPTGVGKTELCKALAETMFADENSIIRIDMSEYMEKHSVSRLIGSPPGYVGYDEGGQLTEAVRRRPYSVILLDEIEKAHPDVFNVLLQIMEDGRLTDGKGKLVNFKNTIIIMTSNVGAHTIKKQKTMGFSVNDRKETEYEKMKENIMGELKEKFKPEFLNRIDDTIVFKKLDDEDMKSIIDLMLNSIIERLKNNKIYLKLSDECKDFLVTKGSDTNYGARPLRRVITKEVEDKLSEELLTGNIKIGDTVLVSVEDNKLKFKELQES